MAMIREPVQEVLALINSATSKVSDESAQMCRLARDSAARKHKACDFVMAETQKCASCFIELMCFLLTLRTRDVYHILMVRQNL